MTTTQGTFEQTKPDGVAHRYVWMPGDASRYEIELVVYAPVFSDGNSGTVTWLNGRHGGVAMRLHGDMPDPGYIADKMNVGDYDASMIAQFLAHAWDGKRWSHKGLQAPTTWSRLSILALEPR